MLAMVPAQLREIRPSILSSEFGDCVIELERPGRGGFSYLVENTDVAFCRRRVSQLRPLQYSVVIIK